MLGKLDEDKVNQLRTTLTDPSLGNVTKLLANAALVNGQHFTPETLQQQLNNKESGLFKLFNNIVKSYYSRELAKEKLAAEQMLSDYRRKLEFEAAIAEESELTDVEARERFTAEQREMLANLESRIKQTEREIGLEKTKAEELNRWASILGNDPVKLAQAEESIQRRFDRINNNLATLENPPLDPDLTEEQRTALKDALREYGDIYKRHLELSSTENLQKYTNHVNADTGLQVLHKNEMHEELYQKFIDRIVKTPVSNVQQDTKEAATLHRYQQLSNGLNISMEKMLNRLDLEASKGYLAIPKDEEVAAVAQRITGLLDSINKYQNEPNPEARKNIDLQVSAAMTELQKQGDYHEIVDFLQKWSSTNNLIEQSKEVPPDTPTPAWIKFTPPLTMKPNGGVQKDSYSTALREVFGTNDLYETSAGFKYMFNSTDVYFDLQKNEIVMNQFDPKIFDKISQVVAKVSPPGVAGSMDLSRLPSEYQLTAAEIAKKNGVEITGLSKENQERFEQQNKGLQYSPAK